MGDQVQPQGAPTGGTGNQPGQGAELAGFVSQFEPTTRTHEIWKGFPKESKMEDLGKRFIEMDGKVREANEKIGKAIFLPDEKATPEERNQFYQKMGRPEKPEGYELKPVEGVIGDDKRKNRLIKKAFELGAPKALLEGLWVEDMTYAKEAQERLTAIQGRILDGTATDQDLVTLKPFLDQGTKIVEALSAHQAKTLEADLRKEWGVKYDANKRLSERGFDVLVEKIGKDKMEEFREAFGNHAAAMRITALIGEWTGEDGKFIPGGIGPPKQKQQVDSSGRPILTWSNM